MGKAKSQVSPKVKFQVVLESLTGDKTLGQIEVVAARIDYYNRDRRHSTIGCKAPSAWLLKRRRN